MCNILSKEVKVNKYHNGKIYKIITSNSESIYIGSTCKELKTRLKKHESANKSYLNGKRRYMCSFEILALGNYRIELIQNYKCNSKAELERIECVYIKNTLNTVNMVIPGRTILEYRQDNKEKFKQYQIDNKEKLTKYKNEYHQINKQKISDKKNEKHTCICGGKYTYSNKALHKRSLKHQKFINQQ